ncbi:MAG: OadG family protein [Clostridia bacterium]|nr:OadG family protein [Clostridia bacterium]
MSNTFVCLMGMGTVFIGLICIVFICSFISFVIRLFTKKAPIAPAKATNTANAAALHIQDKQAIIAGTCAVIAEELGTDVSNIRVLSFKRI